MTADGRWALSASDDRTLKLWDLATGVCLTTFIGESGLLSCAITSDGTMIVAGEETERVHFLRVEGMGGAVGE
jgi:WD40 repeat protein